MVPQQLVVAPVRLKRDIEQVSQERNRPSESFDPYVDEHAGKRNTRDAKLHGAEDDIQRNQRIEDIADPGNQSDDPGDTEPEPARQLKSVVEPPRQRLHIRNPGIDNLAAEHFRTKSLDGIWTDGVCHENGPTK